MSLSAARHWVFDMDGTLTLAVHDFEAIKRALDIPLEDDILGHLAGLPEAVAAAKHAWLLEHERELALAAEPAPGAIELVRELHGRGCQLGILTRNAHELALLTLQAIGLGMLFRRQNLCDDERLVGCLIIDILNFEADRRQALADLVERGVGFEMILEPGECEFHCLVPICILPEASRGRAPDACLPRSMLTTVTSRSMSGQ
mgnify:CR=1 FL=1